MKYNTMMSICTCVCPIYKAVCNTKQTRVCVRAVCAHVCACCILFASLFVTHKPPTCEHTHTYTHTHEMAFVPAIESACACACVCPCPCACACACAGSYMGRNWCPRRPWIRTQPSLMGTKRSPWYLSFNSSRSSTVVVKVLVVVVL